MYVEARDEKEKSEENPEKKSLSFSDVWIVSHWYSKLVIVNNSLIRSLMLSTKFIDQSF